MSDDSSTSHARGQVVYVVDDDATFREFLADALARAGLDVHSHGDAAAFARDVPTDARGCVVLDLHIPNSSGLEIQRTLAERGVHMPIVFVSGDGDVTSVVEAMRRGALDFLEKPVRRDDLIAAVRAALRRDAELVREHASQTELRQQIEELSPREREVCALLISGKSSKQIARELALSPRTVEHHRANALRKLGVTNAVELAGIWVAAQSGAHRPGTT